jgi:ATP-dependent protease ClpP protease subunit
MYKNHISTLGMAAALLAGSCIAQAADSGTRTELDQRNRIWTMQGVTDGSYTGDAERNQVQTRTQEQVRTRTYPGSDYGSRYGQGYESRQPGGGPGGGGRSGGGGGGGRR